MHNISDLMVFGRLQTDILVSINFPNLQKNAEWIWNRRRPEEIAAMLAHLRAFEDAGGFTGNPSPRAHEISVDISQFAEKLLADTPRPVREASRAEPLAKLSQGQRDVWQVIHDAGQRLTTSQVIDALAKKFGHDPSEGMTKQHLAAMVKLGALTNRQDVHPPGYGPPEWS